MMVSKRRYRLLFAGIILVSALTLVVANASGNEGKVSTAREQAGLPPGERTAIAPSANGTTVISSQGSHLVAINPNGTVLYFTDKFDSYFDVDPIPRTRSTVMYTALETLPASTPCKPIDDDCGRQVVARTNLSTGESTVLYSRVDPRTGESEWHDAELLAEDRVLVADMYRDELFVVNTSTGITTWRWELQQYLPLSTGGQYPDDWAHINDVEVLDDGRIMVSLRNQDQVIFLYRNGTVQESWTLGEDDNRSILYEQHNPDYIPAEHGGPAILVADSEKNRVVEFQRVDGRWVQTWHWRDRQLDWPRDADRLPNGHTLITDSHGGRVIEVNEKGSVVWTVSTTTAYEAERLNTGAESAGGESAQEAGLQSRDPEKPANAVESFESSVRSLFPLKVIHGLKHVTPGWMGFYDFGLAIALVMTVVFWGGLELYWADIKVRSPVVRG